jgi:hypothetical protein
MSNKKKAGEDPVPKQKSNKVAAEVEGMQQELKNLQEALGELVDALITEAKPDFTEIKKLQTLKKSIACESEPVMEIIKTSKAKSKEPKKGKSNGLS